MWKNINKAIPIREYVEVDNKLDNSSDFDHLSNAPTGLLGQLIITISIGFIPDTITPHLLNIISPNSDPKIKTLRLNLPITIVKIITTIDN